MRYLAGIALVVALCCTACGGASMALDPVAAAATKTTEQGGKLVMKADLSELPDGGLMSGEGTFDAAGNIDLQMKVDTLDMRFVLWHDGDHLVMYLRGDAFQQDLPPGKQWASIDLTKAAKALGEDPDALMQDFGSGADPTAMFDMLGKSSDGVEKVGTETILNGVEATHYRAKIDLAKLVQEKGATAAQAEKLRKQIQAQEIPVDVWVDGDGYLRKMDEHMSLTMKGETKHMSITVEIPELGDFTVARPTDGVVDLTDKITH